MGTVIPRILTAIETAAVVVVVFTSTLSPWLSVVLAAAFLLAVARHDGPRGRVPRPPPTRRR